MLLRMADGDGRAALTLAEEVWRAAKPGEVFDADGAAGDRAAPRADLRQGPGRPLQSDLGAAQIGARLRSGCGALLPCAHVRCRRGSALSRPAAGAHGDRGHRPGRPAGAGRSPTPPRTPTTISARPRANSPLPRPASISPPRRNRTPSTPPSRPRRRRPRSTARCCRPSTSSTRRPS